MAADKQPCRSRPFIVDLAQQSVLTSLNRPIDEIALHVRNCLREPHLNSRGVEHRIAGYRRLRRLVEIYADLGTSRDQIVLNCPAAMLDDALSIATSRGISTAATEKGRSGDHHAISADARTARRFAGIVY